MYHLYTYIKDIVYYVLHVYKMYDALAVCLQCVNGSSLAPGIFLHRTKYKNHRLSRLFNKITIIITIMNIMKRVKKKACVVITQHTRALTYIICTSYNSITYPVNPSASERTLSGGSTNKMLFSTCTRRLVLIYPPIPSYAYNIQTTAGDVYIISLNGMGRYVYEYVYILCFCVRKLHLTRY